MSDSAPLPRGTLLALFAMGLGVIVIANDFTALNVALPAIEQDFDVDVGTVQWTVNAYVLVFGMGLVTGGRLADMLGRRKIFFIGTAIFAAFSLAGAVAPSALTLIGARVGMGVGAALMWPAVLGMTFAALPAGRAGLAGGLILGIAGIGNALGPLIGGVLTDEFSWRAIFYLNLPVAAFAVLATWKFVHQPPVEVTERRIDYAGIATVSGGLVSILLGLDQAVDWGWTDPRVLALFVFGVLLLTAFTRIERRAGEAALIPPDVIANRAFRAACLTVLMLSAVFFSVVLYAPQMMEKVLGFTALKAGAGMLPMLALFAVVAFLTGRIYDRVGGRRVIIAGTALLAAGPLIISFFGPGSGYAVLIPGLAVTGIGAGFFYPSITTAAVTMLVAARSSLAGGITYMFQIAGGAVGLGLTTALFTSRSENLVASDAHAAGLQMTGDQAGVIHGVLAGTESGNAAFNQLGASAAEKALDVVKDSFVSGVQLSLRVVSAIALIGLIIAIRGVRVPDSQVVAPDSAPGGAEPATETA
jgi:EmrB/QacA subfamily drug resistance transporter